MAHKRKYQPPSNIKNYSKAILEIFRSEPSKIFNYKQISKKLDINKPSVRKLVSKMMYELADAGKLEEIDLGRFIITKRAREVIVGIVDMTSTGAAYIIPNVDGMDDIYVSSNHTANAMNGDEVEVAILKVKSSGKADGEIIHILKRAKTEFVGVVQMNKNFAFVVPDDRKVPADIFIDKDKLGDAKDGEKVVAKMTDWPQGAKNPFGVIIKVLGMPGDNDTEMNSILSEYGLPITFPRKITEAAEKIDTKITSKDIKERRDMRKATTFTIDPVDAKDFDDALSYEVLENGNIEIGVHIADVSHYLQEGSPLDKEAYERGTSVYLVDRVIPMLPEVLSNFACSLRPNEDKLCFSAVFEMDKNGKVFTEWFGRTVIHSDRRFTYEDAQERIETGKGDFAEVILELDYIAKKLRAERFKQGSIDFNQLEVKFELDEKGAPIGVFLKEQKDAHKLIEDFMLLANRRVAAYIGDPSKQKPRPFVYRIHESPDPEKLEIFAGFIKKFGYGIDVSSPKGVSQTMNKLMADVKGKGEEQLISTLAIRTMSKAIYSPDNVGHYGLGFKFYSHFTSPIRRYPDVMVHRLLQKYLDGAKGTNVEELNEQCKHTSAREKLATEAERASIKYKQVEFMKDKVGEIFTGVISGVSDFGIFVEVKETKCEGLVRLKTMTDDSFFFDEKDFAVKGRRNRAVLRMGDEVTIKVLRADLSKKQLDFDMIDY